MPLFKSNVTEDYLLKGCIRNERRIQELLYKQYCQSMMALCITYSKNEQTAVEILQDGFLKIFKGIHTYDPAKSSLYTWMRTIMVRTAIDFLRKNKHQIQIVELLEKHEEFEIEAEVDERVSILEIDQVLEFLPETTKTVFKLFISGGYSHKEIGAFLNISEGTSRWHLSEARKYVVVHLKNRITA